MADRARLDTTRLRAELFFVQRKLSEVEGKRKDLLDELEGETGSPSALIWRALLSDCLRVAYSVAMADDHIYDFELDWIRDLLSIAAPHYFGARNAPYGRSRVVDAPFIRTFLERYRHDDGTFGYGAAVPWRGHELCRRAATMDNRESLRRYARVMRWLIDEACSASKLSRSDPRWHASCAVVEELIQAFNQAGLGNDPGPDRRIQVFLSGARVFTPIQKAVSVYDADPFDVEKLHGDARESFQRLINEATADSHHAGGGRALLVVGSSGYGKTHLLRSFWSYVQEFDRGFVAYAQMDASVDDYTRYFLHRTVESLKCPYSGRSGGRSGLQELVSGLVRLKGQAFADRVDRLAELCGGPRDVLDRQVDQLLDELLEVPALSSCDPDLLRVLLYARCLDPKTTPRIYQYLCCDEMNEHDRSLIGNVVPRTAREDRTAMIHKLAQLAFVSRGAALVLMLDQVELSGVDSDQAMATFQRAIDALLGIESQVRSVVVVIACLSNLYDKALKVMGRPTLDRLMKDPPPARLSTKLSYEEVQALVGQRLAWMFAEACVNYHSTDPVYPIPDAQLRNRVGHRPRDILDWCQEFHQRCVAAGKIVELEEPETEDGPPPLPPRIGPEWSAALTRTQIPAPLGDDDLLALVASAATAYAAETGATLTPTHQDGVLRLQRTSGGQSKEIVIGVTNRGPQAGAFGAQIRNLSKAAGNAIAIAIRTEAFPNGAMSKKAVADLVADGGRAIHLDEQTLRALVANHGFQPSFPAEQVQAWRRTNRPLGGLQRIAEMFDLDLPRPEAKPPVVKNGVRRGAAAAAAAAAT